MNKICKHKLMNMGIRRRRAVFREVRVGAFFGGHSGARQGKEARTVGTVRGGKGAVTIDVFRTLVISSESTAKATETRRTKKQKTPSRRRQEEEDKMEEEVKRKKKTKGRRRQS